MSKQNELGVALQQVLEAHRPSINERLNKMSGKRIIHTRVNISGVAGLLGVDRGTLTAWLSGVQVFPRADLLTMRQRLELSDQEFERLDRLRAATEQLRFSRKGNDRAEPIVFDFRQDQLLALGEWSPNRRLHRAQQRTSFLTITERPSQVWLDPHEWQQAVAARVSDTGDLAYLTGFRIDHQESAETQFCNVTFSESKYAEVRAIERLRLDSPALLAQADAALEQDPRRYLTHAVPSSLAVNVVVATEGRELLCVRRSAAVDNAVGLWSVGIFETLKFSDVLGAGEFEVFFRLVERGLREELHLHAGDYGDVLVSWLGIYQPLLRGHLLAIVSTRLSKAEIVDNARRAHSSYEHDGIAWLTVTRENALTFAAAQAKETPGEAGSIINVRGKTWLAQSRLAVVESWRWLG